MPPEKPMGSSSWWYIITSQYICIHDDVIKWKHFPRYWPFVRGIHRSPVNSSHKGQWRGALMFSLIFARINGWVNNREAGDLRRHQAHCDVIVMIDNDLETQGAKTSAIMVVTKCVQNIKIFIIHTGRFQIQNWTFRVGSMNTKKFLIFYIGDSNITPE